VTQRTEQHFCKVNLLFHIQLRVATHYHNVSTAALELPQWGCARDPCHSLSTRLDPLLASAHTGARP
jgi:hypothetical protein